MQKLVNPPPPAGYSPGPAWNNTPTVTPTAPATGLYPAGPACQPCPDCGGLDCLCRPRFFAGQLLTEQDLNRLDQYIVAKNQLHNRYLVGQGVVCGLAVTCSPCANTVTVAPGYAIDTCGNDIVVCAADTVDICKLIKACTPSTAADCGPYRDASSCRDVEQEWILAVRYQETPSRGITPVSRASQCSCGSAGACSCGGSTKACGCGSMKSTASCCGQTVSRVSPVATNLPRRGAPPLCEPTATCETYRYEVFPAPQPIEPGVGIVRGLAGLAGNIGGPLFDNISACLNALVANLPDFPKTNPVADKVGWSNFCCNTRQVLIQYVIGRSGTDCHAVHKLRAISCPSPNLGDAAFIFELGAAFIAELLITAEMIVECVCLAALPPCPIPGDPRVPLASVRVRSRDCTVLSICDWTPLRKNVVTNRTLGYWLGWLPFVPMLRQFMQEACCNLFGLTAQLGGGFKLGEYEYVKSDELAGAEKSDAMKKDETNPFDKPITFGARSYRATTPFSDAIAVNLAGSANSISVADLARALLDPVDPAAPTDRLAASPHAKVLAEIARPLISSLGPLFQAITGSQTKPAANTQELAGMRAELEAMKTTLATQQAALDALGKQASLSPPPVPGKP